MILRPLVQPDPPDLAERLEAKIAAMLAITPVEPPTMNKKNEAAETVQITSVPAVDLPRLVRNGYTVLFENVSCSQCGRDFGPGEHGFSHCADHSPKGQCADCKWAQEKEDRYDQVRCCCDDSPNAWGDVEATDCCESFLPNDKMIQSEGAKEL